MNANEDFISLRQFWTTFAKQVPAVAKIMLPPAASVVYGLNTYFGNLVNHAVESDNEAALVMKCTGCRNSGPIPKNHVCETHCGVIAGTAEFLLSAPVFVEYSIRSNGDCLITINKR